MSLGALMGACGGALLLCSKPESADCKEFVVTESTVGG